MPSYRVGNIWNEIDNSSPDLVLFPANGVLNNRGALVMGAGFARQVRDRYRGLDSALGRMINSYPVLDGGHQYGLVISGKIGAFQSKLHWRDNSTTRIITYSTKALNAWCERNPYCVVHMPLPGCGLGSLLPAQVKPILSVLPSTVHIWSFRS